jgi:hypothetical protein
MQNPDQRWPNGRGAAEARALLLENGAENPCLATRMRGRTCFCPFCAPSTESMNRSCPSYDFAAVLHSPRDEVLFSRPQRNFLPIKDQRVTSLDHNHVLIELMHVLRCLSARPKRHLAPIRAVEYISFHSGRRLSAGGNPVCRMFHERREFFHGCVPLKSGILFAPRNGQAKTVPGFRKLLSSNGIESGGLSIEPVADCYNGCSRDLPPPKPAKRFQKKYTRPGASPYFGMFYL